jgi:alpha-glucosidase
VCPISAPPLDVPGQQWRWQRDLRGLISRIEYLDWLGIDAVWLCPLFPSGGLDFGYDISDFCAIDPPFGTIADFDALLEALHSRGIKVLLDFVPNNTRSRIPGSPRGAGLAPV